MNKIIIWGTGKEYDEYIRYVEIEKYRGNLEIIGVTSNDTWLSSIGGYSLIPKSALADTYFDYIVVFSTRFYDEIYSEALLYGIDRQKILHGDIFRIPYFDFERYIQVKKSRLTIVSNHCWGGAVYDLLKIPFQSPFINTLINEENYLKLIKNLREYLSLPLNEVEDKKLNTAPRGRLGDVEIQFIHHPSFEQANLDWNRRISRVNYDNIFLEMTGTQTEKAIQEFSENLIPKKVVFSSYMTGIPGSVFIKDWASEVVRARYSHNFGVFILDTVRASYGSSHPIDVLNLLLGNKDFIVKK